MITIEKRKGKILFSVLKITDKGDIAVMVSKTPCVLVCVTGQKDCVRLIETGVQIAGQLQEIPVRVLNVQPACAGYETDGEELEYLRQKARSVSADMTVFFNDDPALITAGFVKQTGAVQIVTGMAGTPTNGFIDLLHKLVPEITISMVSKEGNIYHIYPESVPNGVRLLQKTAAEAT